MAGEGNKIEYTGPNYHNVIGTGLSAAAGGLSVLGMHELADGIQKPEIADLINQIAPVAGIIAANLSAKYMAAKGYMSNKVKHWINSTSIGLAAALYLQEAGEKADYVMQAIKGLTAGGLYGLLGHKAAADEDKSAERLELLETALENSGYDVQMRNIPEIGMK